MYSDSTKVTLFLHSMLVSLLPVLSLGAGDGRRLSALLQYWATRPCAVSVEECSVGRRTGNAGLEMKNI
jgi:hypothetical protein